MHKTRSVLIAIFAVTLVLGTGVVPHVKASPAAPTFLEGIGEWFGDVFTFGDIAKAERNIKKAEAIFQDLSTNAPKDDSLDAFFKNGLTAYQKRIKNAGLYFKNAEQEGKDVSSLGKTIADLTYSHALIFENAKKQWGDKAENIGLLRALEVVKETNVRAREAIGEVLEKKVETEQKTGISSSDSLIGFWKVEKFFSFTEGQWKENSSEDNAYIEFKSDGTMCYKLTITPSPSCMESGTYEVSGDKFTVTTAKGGGAAPQRYIWSIKEGKLELVAEFPDGDTWKPAAKWIHTRAEYISPPLLEEQALPQENSQPLPTTSFPIPSGRAPTVAELQGTWTKREWQGLSMLNTANQWEDLDGGGMGGSLYFVVKGNEVCRAGGTYPIMEPCFNYYPYALFGNTLTIKGARGIVVWELFIDGINLVVIDDSSLPLKYIMRKWSPDIDASKLQGVWKLSKFMAAQNQSSLYKEGEPPDGKGFGRYVEFRKDTICPEGVVIGSEAGSCNTALYPFEVGAKKTLLIHEPGPIVPLLGTPAPLLWFVTYLDANTLEFRKLPLDVWIYKK